MERKGIQKIGILTQYYRSHNYGGLLQAYALCEMLKKMGYQAYQIPFYARSDEKQSGNIFFRVLRKSPKQIAVRIQEKIVGMLKKEHHIEEVTQARDVRIDAIRHFYDCIIPHDAKVYSKEDIINSVEKYDCFICGSDQIWNPKWLKATYLLDFVPKDVPKFSYAASISSDYIPDEMKPVYQKCLSDYIGISVREEDSLRLLENIAPIEPVCSLDPTLLMEKSDWDAVATNAVMDGPYVFCYILGMNKKIRELAHQFAEAKGLKTVGIPFLLNIYNQWDARCYDHLFPDTSPEKFISLIKNAAYVITDSFHACVFSAIYQKNVFVFDRDKETGMSVRIRSLTEMFGIQERYCDMNQKNIVSHMLCMAPPNYKMDEYRKRKNESIKYLHDSLMKANEYLVQK